jgi:tRNA dimethylallyltransferase
MRVGNEPHAGGEEPAQRPVVAPVLALVGPTASGKTAASLAIAERLPVEVISVDSALVYRGLDIGTAKPTADERLAVPHHLIDIRDPWQPYSAADFVADAERLVAEIRSRGRLPLLVGGTMLYLKACAEGLSPLPAADAAVRADIDREAERLGWPALHAELARVDPATAARLAPADSQRIQRALEVYRLAGEPLSTLQARQGRSPAAARQRELRVISLEPTDRSWLHRRIGERLQAMWRAGLLDEVRRLRADPRITANLPAMRAVGYRQCWEALDAAAAGLSPDEGAVQERCTAATRQLAKRQLTWLRSWPQRQVVAADGPLALQHTVDCALLHWG